MQNVQDLKLFDSDDDFLKIKQNSIDEIIADGEVLKILSKYNLDRKFVEDNWIEFLDYYDSCKDCKYCTSLKQCNKVSKGMIQCLEIEDNKVKTSLTPCKFGKELLDRQFLLSHITVSNVSDDLLLSDSNSVKGIMSKELAVKVSQFLSNPQKGLYICGPAGCGKSTLAGFITRSLSRKEYSIGFIHFPTYLIDLKNSFNEYGNDSNIEELRNVDFLIIDDLGGENVTGWSRDEVLFSVLTYRNQNKKITIFTSQYMQDDLIKIYSLKKDGREKIKVERLLNTIFTTSLPIMIKQ